MLFGISTGDILTGWFLGLISWMSPILTVLNMYDSIIAYKNENDGWTEQQKVTEFYQQLTLLAYGLLGISLNFVLRFQLWIGPDSDKAQSVALLPYIRPFYGKIMFIINAALLCLFTSIQLPFILAQFGVFQQRRGNKHFLFAWPSVILPLALSVFLSQMEIPDLRTFSWLFHDYQLSSYTLSDYNSKLMDLFKAYVINKEFNDFASLMYSPPQNITIERDTKFRLQQMLTQILNTSAEAKYYWSPYGEMLSHVNQNIPILKSSLINSNAFLLLVLPLFIYLFLSLCAVVSLAILLVKLKRKRTFLMRDFNFQLSDIDENQRQKIQELDQQIKIALLNVVQVLFLILFLYFPLFNGLFYIFKEKYFLLPNDDQILLPKYADNDMNINSNNLTHLLVALFIVVPILNFVFSTSNRQQKLKTRISYWISSCWFKIWKKWLKKMSPKPFIVFTAVSLLAMLAFYCYSIVIMYNESPHKAKVDFGCNGTLFETDEENQINPLICWAFLLVDLLFTHSMVKFAWNQIGVLTILNFHIGELLRAAWNAYEALPWCGAFRTDPTGFGFASLIDAYIAQFLKSVYYCMDWTPLLIALHRFHIIMVPIQANHFWSKKRIIKACITFWIAMSIPVANYLYNNVLDYSSMCFKRQNLLLFFNNIIIFLDSIRFEFICSLYAIMFCKFSWEAFFSTSAQILSSSDQLHETRSEMIRITMACFLSFWLPRFVGNCAYKWIDNWEEYFSKKTFHYLLIILQSIYPIVETISLIILSKQFRKIVYADLQLLPLLVSKFWRRIRGGLGNSSQQQNPQNNNFNGRNQIRMANGWVGNLETTQ